MAAELAAGAACVGAVGIVGFWVTGLGEDFSFDWKRDVKVGGKRATFFVTNADNLTIANFNVMKGMNASWDNEDHYWATFANDEKGWNKTGTMERNEQNIVEGITHGRFHILLKEENKVDPQGLWIHLLQNATDEQISAFKDLQEGLEATLNGKAQGLLEDIMGKAEKANGVTVANEDEGKKANDAGAKDGDESKDNEDDEDEGQDDDAEEDN